DGNRLPPFVAFELGHRESTWHFRAVLVLSGHREAAQDSQPCRRNPYGQRARATHSAPPYDARPSDMVTCPFCASIALTVFPNAFSSTPLPIVPSTRPSARPLRFLPSRTTTASTSVLPSGRRVNV